MDNNEQNTTIPHLLDYEGKNDTFTLGNSTLTLEKNVPSDYIKNGDFKVENVISESDTFASAIGIQIGNAVPVKLGEIIGKSLVQHVRDNNKKRKK